MTHEEMLVTIKSLLRVNEALNKALTSSMELNLSFSERIIFSEKEKVKK